MVMFLGGDENISKPCWFSNFSGMNIHTHQLPGLVNIHSLLLKIAIEIVDFPIKNSNFP